MYGQKPNEQTKTLPLHDLIKNGSPFLGNVSAPITIIDFSDLPNRGLDSMDAALAAQCTNDQGKFWQFHNLLYSNQKPIDSGWVSKENLKNFASQISGLDIKQFNTCFDNEKYKSFVQKDIDLALSFGFRETPSFIVENSNGSNPEMLSGALPFDSFKAVVEKKISAG
jgi:protein-disulfide isomerase